MHRQASVWDLPGQDGTFRQDVVGESFHAGQFALLLKGVHVDSNGVDLFEKASLVPERRNRFDPLSVAVVIRGQRVGHLPRDDAARLQPTLLAATKAGRDPQVDAMIYARADGERSGKTWHRVRLDLAPLSHHRNVKVTHDLRHPRPTLLLAAGVPVMVGPDRLGPANATIRLGVYAHVMAGMQLEAAAKFGSLLYRGAI
jgi:hypothetical protein